MPICFKWFFTCCAFFFGKTLPPQYLRLARGANVNTVFNHVIAESFPRQIVVLGGGNYPNARLVFNSSLFKPWKSCAISLKACLGYVVQYILCSLLFNVEKGHQAGQYGGHRINRIEFQGAHFHVCFKLRSAWLDMVYATRNALGLNEFSHAIQYVGINSRLRHCHKWHSPTLTNTAFAIEESCNVFIAHRSHV